MEPILISILKKASDSYYNTGDFYVLSPEEKEDISVYFQTGVSEITDDVFDKLSLIAKKEDPSNPFFKKVGSEVRGDKVKLPFVMGSMDETKAGEIKKWVDENKKYVGSAKLDGCSAGLVYEDGKFVIGYSRGNGTEGQDITRHLKRIVDFPKTIDDENYKNIKVRCEVIVPRNVIQSMIDELEIETKQKYKTGRNTVAGQLNSKKCAEAFVKYAQVVAYKIIDWEGTELEMFTLLQSLGFQTPDVWTWDGKELNDEFLMSIVRDIKERNEYECDGIIITMDEADGNHKGFETGTFNPKASRKFKLGATELPQETTIKNIRWQISHDSYYKPVIEIEPVIIEGVTITNITGNNYRYILENDLYIGKKVKVYRAGSVIPQILI